MIEKPRTRHFLFALLLLCAIAACADDPPPQGFNNDTLPPSNNAATNNNTPNNNTPNNNTPDSNNTGIPDNNSSGMPGSGNNADPDPADATDMPGEDADDISEPDAPGEETPWCEEGAGEVCGDGFDNDCDGVVDEGCACTNAEQPCYTLDPSHLTAPSTHCRAGTQACELEFYGACVGEVFPEEEVCDGIDNDCDGEIDEVEECGNEPPIAICPPDQIGPILSFFSFRGEYEDPEGHAIVRTSWRLQDKPAGSTTRPNPTEGQDTEMFADVQGIYVLEFEVEDEFGAIGRCNTRVETNSDDQLRIEMVWNIGNNSDRSDIDLHLLKNPQGRWFSAQNRGDDCFWQNCRVCTESYSQDQAYENSCREQIASYNNDPNRSPPPRVEWTAPLDDNDPRLDLDDVQGNGPENINIKNPINGTYRLGVHYWDDDGSGDSTVTLRVYCRGALAKEFEPVVLRATEGNDGGPQTEFWEVGDIVWNNGCEVIEFGQEGCREICTRGDIDNTNGCPDGLHRGRPCP